MSRYYIIEATRQMHSEEDGYFEEEIVDGAVCSDCYHDLDMGDDADIHVRTQYTGSIEADLEDGDCCEHCGESFFEMVDPA